MPVEPLGTQMVHHWDIGKPLPAAPVKHYIPPKTERGSTSQPDWTAGQGAEPKAHEWAVRSMYVYMQGSEFAGPPTTLCCYSVVLHTQPMTTVRSTSKIS